MAHKHTPNTNTSVAAMVTHLQNENAGTQPQKPSKITESAARPSSRPADPNRPSFLDLAGELRNGVYEALFKVEGEITVTCRGRPNSFSSIVVGIALLATCRQIYSEAVGVLYTQNTFLITCEESDLFEHDDRDLHEGTIALASNWLSDIGRPALLVRSLLIDLRDLIKEWDGLDVAPIMKYLWRRTANHMKVSFVDTEARPSSSSIGEIDCLNSALSFLTSNAAIEIKKYGRFSDLLKQIVISPRGQSAVVLFSPYCPDPASPHLKFDMKTSVIRKSEKCGPVSLNRLLRISSISSMVLNECFSTSNTVTYDLTRKKISPSLLNVVGVNRRLHQQAFK